MFQKILIANRGEIACRVARTARRMGIRTVGVYSEADAEARHVAACDEAHCIGPAAARESYLRADAILEVARRTGAQAVHPGYGFLSENEAFADACARAGIAFIGPPASAIHAMGSKSEAKALMEKAGVPLVPGYHGQDQDPALLAREAERIGFPVLIKATAGGGGKGMRVVERAADFAAALASARREAASSFGDDRVLVEKYLVRPRHIEIQVFADTHGNVVHLFERDCSIQRRHQKVLEEAPAPGMDPATRAAMGEAGISAARAIGYVGAGTIEFLLDADGSFYFMEMNTRLQVEHPITEMITDQDLVEWQLRVAAGEALPLRQEELAIRGHAFEARIYAEAPARDFLPSTGRLRYLRTPDASAHVRIDTGVAQGDEITMHYDPMIAKLIVWDEDRTSALRRLRHALGEYQAVGLSTNLDFLRTLTALPAYAAAELDTGFIARHRDELFPPPAPPAGEALALACLSELLRMAADAKDAAASSSDPHSPWARADGWRLNQDSHHVFRFRAGEQAIEVTARFRRDHFLIELPDGPLEVHGTLDADGNLLADLGGKRLRAAVLRNEGELTVMVGGASCALVVHDPLAGIEDGDAGGGKLTAPMPGAVVQVLVEAGAAVAKGAPLMVLEAMKMEHTIHAPADGRVAELLFAPGDQVTEGAELLRFEAAAK